MANLFGACLLPASGEFTYDTTPAQGKMMGVANFSPINTYFAPGGVKADYSYALDQLQAEHPECQTVALVCAWFGNSTDAGSCNIYPSTNYVGGAFEIWDGSGWTSSDWRVSGLTQNSSGLIPISTANGSANYGGTPSDQSIVRCVEDLKARGFRVVFYPFILMDMPGKPWRGRIGLSSDLSSASVAAVNAFLGSASTSMFTRDTVNLTVGYSGSPTDWTYRRMILHYANLCVIAGGVDLFLIGSELRGLEIIRGPGWTKAGTVDGNGDAVWDYPFVAGLAQLAADARSVFDSAGLNKNLKDWKNLIAYSPDWSSWNGWQHAGENGQWPHLDSLFASSDVDLVSFDNYLPLSDWTTDGGGLDAENWTSPKPTSWPPAASDMCGIGLTGDPSIYSSAYLSGNIEGGEHFDWFYDDSSNLGRSLDPNGSGLMVSQPDGDRLTQSRNPFYSGQELLGRKQFRWWWRNTHQAIYDNGDGSGWAPHGPTTQWTAQMKPLTFAEYGFATTDKCTNQPNVFFSPGSSESETPFWSVWESADGATWLPKRDDLLADTALQAIYDYWSNAANNPNSSAGVPMILTPFCCAWNWDARPFPIFPLNSSAWGDGGSWATGNWIAGKGPYLPVPPSPTPPGAGSYETFPVLVGEGWSVHYKPRFLTREAAKASGRSARSAVASSPLWDIELTFDLLRSATGYSELQEVIAFIGAQAGRATPFLFAPPGNLAVYAGASLGTGDGVTTAFVIEPMLAGYYERVQALIGAPTVYANGAVVGPSSYSLSILPATVIFSKPPAAGVVLTVDFSAADVTRFADDQEDLEEFMSGFWRIKTLRLETVRA